MTTTIRHYSDILKDIENYMSENHLINDLESLHDWQSFFSGEANFCSGTATWLYTFLIYGECKLNCVKAFQLELLLRVS
jgi:hypothetical protein